jgi:large subunit ribosomal protein L31
MKEQIHPEYFDATVYCGGCGTNFTVGSTVREIRVNVCSACHPFYSGKQKLVDAEGRVDRFKKRYAKFQSGGATAKAPAAK